MKNRLEADQGFKIIKENGNIVDLLTEIRGVSNEMEVTSVDTTIIIKEMTIAI